MTQANGLTKDELELLGYFRPMSEPDKVRLLERALIFMEKARVPAAALKLVWNSSCTSSQTLPSDPDGSAA